MKKLFFLALCMLCLTACENGQKNVKNADQERNDSLMSVIREKDNEINDMLSTLNEIQDGFRQITAAENRVTIAKDAENTNKNQQIKNEAMVQQTNSSRLSMTV